ncbi:lytic transglycosylase domain-containing protein [Roseicella aerolata]|uniref:Lytic transglycosylase domain-containing protein n=1 Tax=Roseicella aerolata TaxID=2883479 RepID=A0A9X1IF12_9PROT|nr:lytic transglycosylase domain-containing protein [Roseicella aerolata]MCB4822118.1 lytic transglycosylase domain-containing protein [Roseicella aerolata]
MRLAAVAALALGLAVPTARAERPAPPPIEPGQMCQQAVQAAEREHRLPGGLLLAIARVESGRPDSSGRGGAGWPWTIHAEGQGRYFDSKAEAMAAVEALRARGVRLIDVGCMQVNLHHHPEAFPSLEVAFDPAANARYAALFLTRLYAQSRSWEQAAAHYHSQTPELAEAYRLKVMAAWPAMAARLAEEQRRAQLVAAWTNGRVVEARPIRGNGFQVVAMANAQGQPAAGRGPGTPLLVMGRPVLRPGLNSTPTSTATRPTTTRRPLLLEVAEAPTRR